MIARYKIAINTSYAGKPPQVATGRMVTYKGKTKPEVLIHGEHKDLWFWKFSRKFAPHDVTPEQHARAVQKGYASGSVMKHNHRKGENFISAQHIGIDLDTCDERSRLTVLQADPFIAQYGGMIHTSPSHTESAPRARVYFYLDEPVTDPEQYKRYVLRVLAHFPYVDQQCEDLARLFYGAVDCDLVQLDNTLPLAVLDALPDPPTEIAPRTPQDARTRVLDGDSYELYTENNARAAWGFSGPNGNEFSEPFCCPFHDDHNPSAQWNYRLHNIHCFVCGTILRDQVATMLGLLSFDDYRAARRSTLLNSTESLAPAADQNLGPMGPIAPAPERDQPVRYFENGIPARLVELLNGLHTNSWLNVKTGDVKHARAGLAGWALWHELVITGALHPDQPITVRTLTDAGMNDYTARAALDDLQWLGIFRVSIPSSLRGTEKGIETQIINRPGRKAAQYSAEPLAVALPTMIDLLAPHVLRVVLVKDYPHVMVSAEHVADLLGDTGATIADLERIDRICAPLYESDQADRAKAYQGYTQRVRTLRAKYSYAALFTPSPRYPVTPVRFTGCDFSNAARFLDSLNAADMGQHNGQRDIKDRWSIQNLTGRSDSAHRASNERVGIVAVPQYDDHALSAHEDVITQAASLNPRAYRKGLMRLIAENGAAVALSEGRAETFDFEDWIDQNGGAGRVALRVVLPSIEKTDPDDHELAAVETLAADQRLRSAKRWNGDNPQANVLPAPDLQRRWFIAQGARRAGLFGLQAMPEDKPRQYWTAYGAIVEYADVWQGIVTSVQPDLIQKGRPEHGQETSTDAETTDRSGARNTTDAARKQAHTGGPVRGDHTTTGGTGDSGAISSRGSTVRGAAPQQVAQGGDDMPTMTAYSAPVERETYQDSEPAEVPQNFGEGLPANLRQNSDKGLPMLVNPAPTINAINTAAKVTPQDAHQHTCYECGAPAAVLSFEGWRCEACHTSVSVAR